MNRRKNLTLIILVLVFFAVLMYGLLGVMDTGKTTVSESGESTLKEAETLVEDEKYELADMQYMVKEYYGNIGVYIKSEEEYVLISIVDMDITVLPEADVRALRDGIYLENKEKLQMLIEDYTS